MSTIEGYTLLEYIESLGNLYIDTGVSAKPTLRVWVDFAYTNTSTLQQRIFGATVDGNMPSLLSFDSYINGSGYYAWSCQDANGNWQSTDIIATTNRHTLDLDSYNSTVKIDNGATYSATITTTRTKSGTNTIYLMDTNYNNSGSGQRPSYAKLYACKMYESGILIRDYIPCKNSNDVSGLYDKVNNVFYISQGSANFIAGPEVLPPINPYKFRRRCFCAAYKGVHIKEGLDFWYDGLDNNADGVYDPSIRIWRAKSDNSNISSRTLVLKKDSYFDNNGGLVVRMSSSRSVVGAVSDGWAPYYYLDTYDSKKGFTIECVVDIERENPYKYYYNMWGISYNNNAGADYRGGLYYENELFYQYNKNGWIPLKPGYVLPLGKHIITVTLTTDSKMKYYVDGIKVGNDVPVDSNFRIAKTVYNELSLGAYSAGNDETMLGVFYSYKSYSRVLSDKEIMDSANFAKLYYKL